MADDDDSVRTSSPHSGVLLVELDRPRRHNALDLAMVRRLTTVLATPDARVVILTSSRSDTFCSGADLSISNDERAEVSDLLYDLYESMIRLPIPIIAAIAGPAIGGGAQLAVAADLRVAAPTATFRFVGAGHGLAVGAWALPRLVGAGLAFEWCATMRPVDAGEASRTGLVNIIADDPVSAALDVADQLVASDAAALARIKAVIAVGDRRAALGDERTGNRDAWDGRPPPQGNVIRPGG